MAAKVRLNIYDVTSIRAVSHANKLLKPLGTGAFHAGVEIHGVEYSFGYCDPEEGSGIFPADPTGCEDHKFRESIDMGEVNLSEEEVEEILEKMDGDWAGDSYDLLRHNCCHFSDALCVNLGVGHVPGWVVNLAGAGATLMDGFSHLTSKAEAASVVAAAKAGEIDEKYNITTRVKATTHDVLHRATELDQKLTQGRVVAAAKTVEAKAREAAASPAVASAAETTQAAAKAVEAKARELAASPAVASAAETTQAAAAGAVTAAQGAGRALFGALRKPRNSASDC